MSLEATLGASLPDDPPGRLGRRDASEGLRSQRLAVEQAADQGMGAVVDDDAARIGYPL